MNLLILVLLVTFFTSLWRGADRQPIRTVPLVAICGVIALGYLSQRVI